MDAPDAALAVARREGLGARGARLLHDGSTMLFALDPFPVVARIAAATALVRPAPGARRPARSRSGGRPMAAAPGRTRRPGAGPDTAGAVRTRRPCAHVLGPGGHVGHRGRYRRGRRLVAGAAPLLAGYDGELPGPQPLVADALRGVELARQAGLLDPEAADRLPAEGSRYGRELAVGSFALHGDCHPGEEFRVDDELLALCVRARAWQITCWRLIAGLAGTRRAGSA